MGFLRRNKRESEEREFDMDAPQLNGDEDAEDRKAGYSVTMEERMRRLDSYSYEYDETEAAEVEARIRRMFYGAKVEDE